MSLEDILYGKDSFNLFTDKGNAMCHRLMSEIADDVRNDRLTRKQALQKTFEAMHAVSEIDGGMLDGEPGDAIARFLNRAFAEAGYERVDGSELTDSYLGWVEAGGPNEAAPANDEPLEVQDERLVRKVLEAVDDFNRAVGRLREAGATVVFGNEPEYFNGEWPIDEPNTFGVFTWHGEDTGTAQITTTWGEEELANMVFGRRFRKECEQKIPAELREAALAVEQAEDSVCAAMTAFGTHYKATDDNPGRTSNVLDLQSGDGGYDDAVSLVDGDGNTLDLENLDFTRSDNRSSLAP